MLPSLFGLDSLMGQSYTPADRQSVSTAIPSSLSGDSGLYPSLGRYKAAKKNQAGVPNPTRKPLASPMPRPGNLGLAIALSLIANSIQKGAGTAGLQGYMQGNQLGAQMQDQQNDLDYQAQLENAQMQRNQYGVDADIAGKEFDMEFSAGQADKAHRNRLLEIAATEKGDLDSVLLREFLNPQKPYANISSFDSAAGVMLDRKLITPERYKELRDSVQKDINDENAFKQLSTESDTYKAMMLSGETPAARVAGARSYLSRREAMRAMNPSLKEDPYDAKMADDVIRAATTETIDEKLGTQKLIEAIRNNDPKGAKLTIERAEAVIKQNEAKYAPLLSKAELDDRRSRAAENKARAAKLKADVAMIRAGKDPTTGRPITDTASIGLLADSFKDIGELELKAAEARANAANWQSVIDRIDSGTYVRKSDENIKNTKQSAELAKAHQERLAALIDAQILAKKERDNQIRSAITQSQTKVPAATKSGNKILSIVPK